MSRDLKLYEALEQRREYKRIIRTFEQVQPENRVDRWGERNNERPVKEIYIDDADDRIQAAKFKLHKLNEAIQIANRNNTIVYDRKEISIATALELRKEIKIELEELEDNLPNTAYYEVKYKSEGENEKVMPYRDYEEMRSKYLSKLEKFRKLNFALRQAQYKIEVDFKAE